MSTSTTWIRHPLSVAERDGSTIPLLMADTDRRRIAVVPEGELALGSTPTTYLRRYGSQEPTVGPIKGTVVQDGEIIVTVADLTADTRYVLGVVLTMADGEVQTHTLDIHCVE